MAAIDDNKRLLEQRLPKDPEADAEPVVTHASVFGRTWKPLGHYDGLAWFTTEPPPRRWLIELPSESGGSSTGMPLGKVGMLAAAGGVGKTMALVQLALAVATGRKWLDTYNTPNPGHVLLALGEEDVEEMQRRVYAASRLLQLTEQEQQLAAERVFPLPLAATRLSLTNEQGLATDVLEELLERLHGSDHPWSLIALDPLSRFAGLDAEVDNHAATAFIEILESLTKVPGSPSVIIAHHSNKASRDVDGDPAATNASRGASALTDGVRWVANLAPDRDQPRHLVRLTVSKSNYSPHAPQLMLVRTHEGALRSETHAETVQREKKKGDDARSHPKRHSARHGGGSPITEDDY